MSHSLEEKKRRMAEARQILFRPGLQLLGLLEKDVKKAMQRTREALNARTIKYATADGKITDVKEFVDHPTRIAAADRIFEMVPGVKASKHDDRSGPGITVEIATYDSGGNPIAVRVKTDA